MLPRDGRGVGKAHKNRHPRRGPQLSWLRNVEEIMDRLDATAQQYFDRRDIENLFQLRTTASWKLMQQIGVTGALGEVIGTGTRLQSRVIARRDLMLFIAKARNSPTFFYERQRHAGLQESLSEAAKFLAARKIRITADPDIRKMAGLPAGVHLKPGELRIEFFGAEDLLRHLFELSQAMTHDFEAFRKAVEE